MKTDRFGNPFAEALPYARGAILTSTEDDFRKLQQVGRIVRRRIDESGPEAIFNFTGLEHGLPLSGEDILFAHDEIAPALYTERLRRLTLEHLGGSPDRHDVMLFNRLTAATLATHLVLVKPDAVVIGVSASHSHPSVIRAAAHVGARLVDTKGVAEFTEVLERETEVALVVLTRLAVTYEALSVEALQQIVRLAHERDILVYADEAGGARVGPAILEQPKMLELGVDLGATGLDKYGTSGPRVGLMAGEKQLVARIRARAWEFGLEARPLLYPAVIRSLEEYTPGRVQALVDSTKQVATALRALLGSRIHETPVIAELPADEILELVLERAGLSAAPPAPIVPYEAAAALAMLLLQDYGILAVHFAALPPGTADFLFKFMPPDTVERFGGPTAFAQAVDASLHKLAGLVTRPEHIRQLLFG